MTTHIIPLHGLAAAMAKSITPTRRRRLQRYAHYLVSTRVLDDAWLEDAGLIDATGELTAVGWLVADYNPSNVAGPGWCRVRQHAGMSDSDIADQLVKRMRSWRAVRIGYWCAIPTREAEGTMGSAEMGRPEFVVRHHPAGVDGAEDAWPETPAKVLQLPSWSTEVQIDRMRRVPEMPGSLEAVAWRLAASAWRLTVSGSI